MKKYIIFVLIVTFAYSLSSARADEMNDMIATAEKACSALKSLNAPKSDQPEAGEIAALKGCDSASLYYGIGQPVDVTKARLCAFAEVQNDQDGLVFGGSSVLMMIYANGLGVKKNIPLAQHYACGLQASPAELGYRQAALEKLKSSPDQKKKFDLCDDVTSGFMQGHCASIQQRLTDAKDDKVYQAIFAKWSVEDKKAFKKLRKAADDFIQARSSNEVDSSGTARAALEIQEQDIQEKDFLQSLQKFEAGKAPKYSTQEAKKSDQELNKIYKAVQATTGDAWGSITKEKIKDTQLAWIKYRDAWVAFAKRKYPTVPPDSVATWFTKKRTHMLKSFAH